MPWQAARVGTRAAASALLVAVLLPAPTPCTQDDGAAPATLTRTTDADCAARLPDAVFTTLGWTPTDDPAEITVRGCHRETEQGYVEVRDRTGYDQLCATLDRTGSVAPGQPADWLDGRTACAVEPAAGVGTTRVVVDERGDAAVQITVTALTETDQALVRAAVDQLAD